MNQNELNNDPNWVRLISSLVGPELGIVALTYTINNAQLPESVLFLAVSGIIGLAAIRGLLIWKQHSQNNANVDEEAHKTRTDQIDH